MAKILKTNGTTVELKGEGPNGTLTLKQLQVAVAGPTENGDGCIDILSQGVLKEGKAQGSRRSADYDKCRLVVNDNGMSLGLPLNARATELYQATRPGCSDPIVGDVILAEWDEIE